MTKTGHQIETDVYNMLKGTALAAAISGGIYRGGTRPRDSVKEDLVVVFTTADGAQVQNGVVTLNVFIPDVYPFENGVPVEDIARCEVVEGLVQAQVDAMTAAVSDYKFELKNAVHTQRDDAIRQSFVVAKLSFKLYTNNTNS